MARAADRLGMLVWFDPTKERVSLEVLTEGEKLSNLDSVDSVSADEVSLIGPDSPANHEEAQLPLGLPQLF